MSFAENNLAPGEQILFMTELSWIVYLSAGKHRLLTFGILGFLLQRSSEFVVTNRRVMIKTGLVSTRTLELNISKIESVSVNQGLFDKLIGAGDIVISGSGGTREVFAAIRDPLGLRMAVHEATHLLSAGNAAPESSRRGSRTPRRRSRG
jgi:uncharacterized membrane protein YdbT with pleckstrin-like domain